tara:strand:+ start:349 stop:1410 length:1062 start_codon:yes stop_codon:yes gene_type:complete
MSGSQHRKRSNVFPQGGSDSKRQRRDGRTNIFESEIELMNDGSDTSSRTSQRRRQTDSVIVLDSDDDSVASRSPITRSRANRQKDAWGVERQQQNARRRQMEEKKLTIDRQLRIEQDLELRHAMEMDRKRKRNGGDTSDAADTSSKRVKVEKNEDDGSTRSSPRQYRHGPPVPAQGKEPRSPSEVRNSGRNDTSRRSSRGSYEDSTRNNGNEMHSQGNRDQDKSRKRKRVDDGSGRDIMFEKVSRKKEAYLFTFDDEAIDAGAAPDQIVLIKMRLPNGASIQRRFLKTDSLYMLFGWAQSELVNHQIQFADLRDAKLLRYPADCIPAKQEGLGQTSLEDVGITKPTVFHFSLD